MTLNIWNLSGPWRERRVEIAAWLTRLSPDVVCLQEVIENADGRNQARELADTVGGYHVAYGGSPMWERTFGNAVLSRWPIDDSTAAPLYHAPKEGEVGRVAVHARTGGYDVFSTHLNWEFADGWIREVQVQELAAFVDARADGASPLPAIIGGDFNADPDSTEIRFLAGLASLGGRSVFFQDAWRLAGAAGPGWTWDNRNPFAAAEREPDRRIDYIFSGWRRDGPAGAGRVESARVVCNRALTGTYASDHFGVLAEIATA
jgi:endonuclease/exonuclease/phosphatase family metal-dependent hydrolase